MTEIQYLIHPGLHKLCRKYAHADIVMYATYCSADAKYTKDNNDQNYVPQPCRIVLALQPTSRVAKSDGFKNRTRESAWIVEQCRQLPKAEWMKTTYGNTLNYKEDIAWKLVKSLYKISKLLCAQESKYKMTNVEHQAVAYFLRKNHRQVFVFLGIKANAEKESQLKKLYCSENSMDAFSLPKHDTLPPAAVARHKLHSHHRWRQPL